MVEEKVKVNNKIFSGIFVERYPEMINIFFKINLQKHITDSRNNENIKSIKNFKLKIDEFCRIQDYFSPIINTKICFDQIGISSVCFDFKIKKEINTDKLIKTIKNARWLVDEILAAELKKNIKKIFEKQISEKDDDGILNVHYVHPFITSINANMDLNKNKKDISGLVSLNERYKSFNEKNNR